MRSTVFAAAASSVAALVGFAGAANASATIDLLWYGASDEIGNVTVSAGITLQVILTAGPNGSQGAVVSVDYSDALGTLAVHGFASTQSAALPLTATPIDTGSRIENIHAVSFPPSVGTGLQSFQSVQIGTVTFHSVSLIGGVFEIRSDADSPTDAVLDLLGNDITATTTFNSAFLINIPNFDGDTLADHIDNCSERANDFQVDTDADDCGNLCDADYNQSGIVDIGDFGAFAQNFGTNNTLYQHTPPINSTTTVSIGDFGFFAANFSSAPGPSGTTAGTTACP